MRVQPINYFNNYSKNNINFRSSNRRYYDGIYKDSYAQGYVYNCTSLFRNDLDWDKLTKFIVNNFKGKDKINLYSLGCSDGSESYSMAIKFLELQKKRPKEHINILPITAIDKDTEMIRLAKSGKINLLMEDISELNKQIGEDNNKTQYFKYLTPQELKTTNYTSYIFKTYTVSDDLKDAINFEEGDILETLKNINDNGNTVIMCRNTLPFVDQDYINETVATLSQNLKRGSLFVIGQFDEHTNISPLLLENGFEKTPVENVYRRV